MWFKDKKKLGRSAERVILQLSRAGGFWKKGQRGGINRKVNAQRTKRYPGGRGTEKELGQSSGHTGSQGVSKKGKEGGKLLYRGQ